jgi:hypothetical protein
MAKRMSTAARMDRMRDKSAQSRTVNGLLKRKERKNRDARMQELLKKGSFPYTPAIMSWVSVKLGKPTTLITAEEAATLAN